MLWCLILSQKVLKCHTWLPSLVDWITISPPAWHRWVKHFDTTLLTRHLRIVCSCRLEANISSWYFHTSKVAIAGVWQTNPGWIIRLPILQCRSGSSNVLARPTGPVTRAQKSELRVVRVWNEMSRITRLSITATKYTCAACFKNLKEIGFERKTKRCVRFDAPFMKDCEFQLRTFGRSKAASRRCGFRRWPVTARRGETRKALATALVRWLPEPSNDGSCPPDWTSVGLRCLMITVAYNTNFKI